MFVLSDDLRWDCMSVAGHPFLKTPNIDRIAKEGIRFANAFCTSSLCSPSRASFLSGLYAHSHRVINNFTEFPASIPSYPQRLHDAGYKTDPNGGGQPDTEKAELYNVKADPLEKVNLIDASDVREMLTHLTAELVRIQNETGGIPDQMPINPQLRFKMPDAAIR